MTEYIKTEEDGKVVYRYAHAEGEVPIYRWDLDEFINFCLFPMKSFMQVKLDADSDDPNIDVLERLYGAAKVQIGKMAEVLNRDLGRIQVVLTNHRTEEFMQETILGCEFEKEEKQGEDKQETPLDRLEAQVGVIEKGLGINSAGDQHASA